MRIAIVTDLSLDGALRGGVENSAAVLIRGLRDQGISVDVIAPWLQRHRRHADEGHGFPVTRLPLLHRGQILRDYRPWTHAVHAELDSLRPDIVHGQGVLHNGVAAATWHESPTVVTAHGNPLADARTHYPVALNLLFAPLLRRTMNRVMAEADGIINVAAEWQVNLHAEPPRMHHIPNPIDPAFYDHPIPSPRTDVHFFGGGRTIKGADLLLAAWPAVLEKTPSAQLHMYGFPHSHGPLPARVNIHEPLDHEGVALAMSEGGVVVVPSRYEVAPLVIAEAWACGVPVVATRVGGIEAMADGAAILASPNPSSIADALTAAMQQDEQTDALVNEGRLRAESHRPDTTVTQHIELYKDVLGAS